MATETILHHSGDASTTRRKVSVPDAQLPPPIMSLRVILAILIVASRQIRNTAATISEQSLYSVRQLKFGERAPPAVCALVHRYRSSHSPFCYSVRAR